MNNTRKLILDWIGDGHLIVENVSDALTSFRTAPTKQEWFEFLKSSLIWLAVLSMSSGVIFFFAYNWSDMSRWTKFGLVEAGLLFTGLAFARYSNKLNYRSMILTGMALLTGALLALVGQIYQTGADPWQLFFYWSLLILPWTVIDNRSPLWLFWIVITNVSLLLYFDVNRALWGIVLTDFVELWVIGIMNFAFLASFEFAARSQASLNRTRYPERLLAILVLLSFTSIGIESIYENWESKGLTICVIVLITGFYYYRNKQPDLVVLSCIALSSIAFVTNATIELVGFEFDTGYFLLIGIEIIALSSFAAVGLRKIALEFAQRSKDAEIEHAGPSETKGEVLS